jgi:uncharacterized membrane protein
LNYNNIYFRCVKENSPEKLPVSSARLESLGDGIFAVAMTILILDIRIPGDMHIHTLQDFKQNFSPLLPNLLCYIISFIVLGIMWFGHRMMFEYISRMNRYFIFLGVLFYAVICFVPFTTKLLASDTEGWYNIFLYGANLSICNITLFLQWNYGINNVNLLHRELPNEVRNQARLLFLLSPVVYSIAIIIAWWFPVVSLWIFVVTPVLYLLPNKLDKYLP